MNRAAALDADVAIMAETAMPSESRVFEQLGSLSGSKTLRCAGIGLPFSTASWTTVTADPLVRSPAAIL